jgi:hypothetical protein
VPENETVLAVPANETYPLLNTDELCQMSFVMFVSVFRMLQSGIKATIFNFNYDFVCFNKVIVLLHYFFTLTPH